MNSKLVVALDLSDAKTALATAKELKSSGVNWVKVGLELFTSSGPNLISKLKELDLKIFLDLKLFDIPNTVQKTSMVLGSFGVDLITVHAMGGVDMMKAAVQGAGANTHVVAVTILTSFTTQNLSGLGKAFASSSSDSDSLRKNAFLSLSSLASDSGVSGLVTRAVDLPLLQNKNKFINFVTPGIRDSGDLKNDQIGSSSAEEAIGFGSTHLVVGRPILSLSGEQREQKVKEFLKKTGEYGA